MFIRVVTLCFVTLVLTACVTGEKFAKISQGMSRADVIDRLGSPDGVQTEGTVELLTYANRFMSDWSWDKADYKVLLNNGFVVQYGATNIYHDTGTGERMMAAGQIMQQTWDLRAPAPTPSHLRATVAIKGSFRGAEF